ncbi:MAG: PTS sugar transporter subunit IIB [Tissierellia bacterium]|nr:PTS sugar transporter subunit IIB [Tissierellia bacterium]
MAIELVRIDDRLIHGQVATTWTKDYDIEQILVINDKAKNDTMLQSIVGFAAPKGVKIHIFGVEQFLNIIKKQDIKRRTMLIFTNPIDILYLVENGLEIEKVNAGGMQFKDGKKRITKAISVNEEENEAFKKLIEKDITVFVQMVPKDPYELYEDYIK